MPTTDLALRLHADDVLEAVAAMAFQPAGLPDQRGVGLEAEFFSMRPGPSGPVRLTIDEQIAMLGAPGPWVAGSGELTFEPGGQIEYSGGVQLTGAHAMADLDRVVRGLRERWAKHGAFLVSAGTDVWTDADVIEQQLAAPRYRAMAAYLASRGTSGRVMMRNTCSLQVNLDPGTGDVADERWRVANLAAPVTTATFACSPANPPDTAVSTRSRAWRRLDPSRTGVPSPHALAQPVDRARQWADFALRADILMFHARDGSAEPGAAGFSMRYWIERGHEDHGWPTKEDLGVHLTTLFPEVRPRGALEVRSIDAVPRRWRPVPMVLLTGLLYDDEARGRGLALLGPRAGQLQDDLVRASDGGLKDAELCAVAVELWSFALDGARRLGRGWHREQDIRTAEAFIDSHPMRGRCPSDDLRDHLARDPDAALDWVTEPAAQSLDAR